MNNNQIIGYDPMTGQPIYNNQNQINNNANQQSIQKNMNESIINSQVGVQQLNNENKKAKNNKESLIKILIVSNVLTTLLAIIFLVAFIFKGTSAVSNQKIEEENNYNSTATTKPVSNDFTKYQFSINGKTLSLPCSYREFKDISGFSMKSSDEKSYLQRRSSTYVNLYIKDVDKEKLALYIDIKNNTEEDLQYSETEVVSLWQTMYQVQTNNSEVITFPGNLKVGMEITKEKIIELIGEPTTIKDDSEKYGTITLSYNMDESYTTVNYYKIQLRNGKIDEIWLDHKKSS